MGGQRHVLAELTKEFAFAADERVRLESRDDQPSEYLALDLQRCRHERPQAAAREALREREVDASDIGLVDELALHASREAILVDIDPCPLWHRQFKRQGMTVQADRPDDQHAVHVVVVAQAGEIDRQLIFDAADHDLEDTVEILPVADRARDLVEEAEALKLGLEPIFGKFAVGDVANKGAERNRAGRADRRNRQFDRELPTIAMQRGQFDALAKHMRFPRRYVTRQALPMRTPIVLRHDRLLDLASDRLLARPAERLFGLRIPAPNDPSLIDAHDRIDGPFQDDAPAHLP